MAVSGLHAFHSRSCPLHVHRPMMDFYHSSGRRNSESRKLSEHNCGSVFSNGTSVFTTENGIFQQGSVPCQKAKVVLEEIKQHKNEYQLVFWPPNSVNLNPIGHI
ncbi:hypothetical protein TNCV_4987641 [Trichonephila clavipes]|nr:hypothetical protein TNCV_4987641 [Trichonephila clavipes]